MEGKNPYSLRTLPARQKRKADASAAKGKEENKREAKRASKSETKHTKTKTELSDEDQAKIIRTQIKFIERVKQITETEKMNKPARVKERKLKFEAEHKNFNDEYADALEQWQSVEEVGADYDILLEPFNEYCEYVNAHCELVRDVEAEALTEGELNADADVKNFVREIYDKAKEIKKKYVRMHAKMNVLRKQKEKEEEPSEVQILLEEIRGRSNSQGNNNFFKRAELKHGNFKPGESNFKEWFEVFEMSSQNLPEAPKLLLLQQSLEGTAKECIRNITPHNGGYKLAVANLKTTYGDAIKTHRKK